MVSMMASILSPAVEPEMVSTRRVIPARSTGVSTGRPPGTSNQQVAAASVARARGGKAGGEPAAMLDVLNASSGRNSATLDKIPKHVLKRKLDFGFANALSFKDVRLCLDEAEALGVPMVVGAAVRQMLSITHQLQGAAADCTDLIKVVENWAGCQIGDNEE